MDPLFSLIIVEDDDHIRNGLAQIVDWQSMGFSVSATFDQAESALAYLRNHQIDVILTDIRLGELSGLDLAAWVKENLPHTKVVVLSGYSDFAFAQSAIENNVYSYLLKPSDTETIRSIFERLYSDLAQTQARHMGEQKSTRWSLQSLLQMMMVGKWDEKMLSYLHMLALGSFNAHGYIAYRLTVMGYKDTLLDAFYDAFKDQKHFIIVSTAAASHLYVLVLPKKPGELADAAYEFEQQLDLTLNMLHTIMGIRMIITTSRYSDQLKDVLSVFRYDEPAGFPGVADSEDASKITQALKDLDALGAEATHNRISSLPPHLLQAFGIMLLTKIQAISTSDEESRLIGEYHSLFQSDEAEMGELIDKLLTHYKTKTARPSTDVIDTVCAMIDEQKGKVSLSQAAEQVHISQAYLSRLFRERKNINFKQYAIAVSMTHAKDLLANTNLYIYEIAEILGYKDTRHFYSVFGRCENMTPKQYRRKAAGKDLP